jgi:hypothetical protein
MKKIYSTIVVLVFSYLVLFSSCSKNDDNLLTPASPEATVSLNENTNTTGSDTLYVKRDKINAVIQVNGISLTSTDMQRIYVYKKSITDSTVGAYVNYNGSGFSKDVNNNFYYNIPPSQKNNAGLTLTITLNANNVIAVSDEYYFAFTDGSAFAGPTNTTGILLGPAKIFIVYGILDETTGYRLNNIQGPNSGAFDLITLSNKAAADLAADKDMVDFDSTTALWDKSFSAGTSLTLYAKLPSTFDYIHATDLSIKHAYISAGNATNTEAGIVLGDMYVAKLRTLTQYALIKVTFISDESGTTGNGNNNEYMEFSVKK